MSLGEELLYEIGALLLEDPEKIAKEISPEEAEELRLLQERVMKMKSRKRKTEKGTTLNIQNSDSNDEAIAAENSENFK